MENFAQVLVMILGGLTGYKDVIKVGEHRWDIMKDAIHQPLEHLCSILEAKGIQRNFHRTKGVMISVLGMSSGAIGIWW